MSPKNSKRKSHYAARRSLQSVSSRPNEDTDLSPCISAKQKKEFLQPYVDDLVQIKLDQNKKLLSNSYTTTIEKLKGVGINWVTLDSLKSKVKRAYAVAIKNKVSNPNTTNSCVTNTTPPPPVAIPSDTSRNIPTVGRRKGGRPKGSTDKSHSITNECCKEATNEITDLYYSEYLKVKATETDRVRLRKSQERVTRGTYQQIHDSVKKKRNLPSSFVFSYDTCRKRINKGIINPTNNLSPLEDIEKHIVTLILALADCGNPLTVGNALPLINSLIQDTPHQQKVIDFKRKHKLNYDKDGIELSDSQLGSVGVGYWRSFLNRHKGILATNKGRLFELNRSNWTLYSNFRDMYINVENHMVDANVAETLPEPCWMDKEGKIVSEEDSYGMKVTTKLTHPHCCLAMDETGGDTSMMNDGAAAGEKYIGKKGQSLRRPAGKKRKKYTTIGLTGLDGNAAMCVVIFAGVERNVLMETGVDTSKFGDGSNLDLDKIQEDLDFFRDNFGDGKLFPGGPTCKYNGKEVPCMIRYSRGGGITPDILTDILKTLDTLGVFEKERENGIKPFLLLDGHQSRFSVPFLQYITDPSHPWKVCIGVPYGTAIWQIGDSVEQNGRYKITSSVIKQRLLRRRICEMVSEVEILPTDIIIIINAAWNKSFADKKGNKEAIVQRGWFPLNRNLLLLPELRKTMTPDDHDWETRTKLYPENRLEIERKSKEQDPSLPTMRDNSSNRVANTATPSLNTTQGVSGRTIEFLLGQEEQKSIRAESSKKRKAGQTIRDGFKRIKSLTAAGQMIAQTGTFEIGINTLNEVNRRVAMKQAIKDEEDAIKKETHMKNVGRFNELRLQKPLEENWTIKDCLTALRVVKKNGDRANPKNREELMAYWKELSHRSTAITVEQKSELLTSEGCEVVRTNSGVDSHSSVHDSNKDLHEKEGANQKATTAM